MTSILPLNSLARCNWYYGGCDPNGFEQIVRSIYGIFGFPPDPSVMWMLPVLLGVMVIISVLFIKPLPESKIEVLIRAAYGIAAPAIGMQAVKFIEWLTNPENVAFAVIIAMFVGAILGFFLIAAKRALQLYRNLRGGSASGDDRGRSRARLWGYAILAVGVVVLLLFFFSAPPPLDQADTTAGAEQGTIEYNASDPLGSVQMTGMYVNDTPTAGSPVNVSIWMSHGGNETETVNRTLELFDREYNALRDVETVSLQLPPNGSDSVTTSLAPPDHSGNYTIGMKTPYGEMVMQRDITVRCDLNASADSDVPEELREYEIPDYVDIHRLEPADDRVPVNETIALELNATNECNQAVTFSPPLFAYDQSEDVRMGIEPFNVTIPPGETVHDEIVVLRPDREADLWIGIGFDAARISVGHVDVYNSTTQEVENR